MALLAACFSTESQTGISPRGFFDNRRRFSDSRFEDQRFVFYREVVVRKAVSLCFVFCLCASAAYASPMPQQELKQALLGKTLEFRTRQGATGKVRYSRSGKVKLWNHNYDPRIDKGTWRFKGNSVCATWKKLRNGREACFTATRLPGHRYRTSIGIMFWRR